MQRRATKRSTRAANTAEKRFQSWVAQQRCVQCGSYPVIVDHLYGSAFIHNKALIGHWAVLPLCPRCDGVKTNGSHKSYLHEFGETQAQTWLLFISKAPAELMPPPEVIAAVKDWNR